MDDTYTPTERSVELAKREEAAAMERIELEEKEILDDTRETRDSYLRRNYGIKQ